MSISRARRPPSDEAGFSLVAVIAGVTIMMTLMGAAVPAWRYVMKDDREEELFFRGNQIASSPASRACWGSCGRRGRAYRGLRPARESRPTARSAPSGAAARAARVGPGRRWSHAWAG